MDLKVGQKVTYPNQGVCLVEGIKRRKIGDLEIRVYELRLLGENSLIYVPVKNVDTVGLRPVLTYRKCRELVKFLSEDFGEISCDWKSRSKDFIRQLQSGDVFEAADVLKKLTYLGHEKKLSFREQTLLEKSRFLVISEITNAGVYDEKAISNQLEKLVEQACKKHRRAQLKVMAAGSH
ncbi:MAG TPA: CarD family transcriptional regulator [Pyrinomonadaceae bacterium]|jgi:CarD family transcriptional regulator|nr:CarD family transcriptional regulator [Pyrinomonadaceae bacterium]